MKTQIVISIGLLVATAAGCVSTPPLTRDEQLVMTSRQYAGLNSQDVIKAAEEVVGFAKPRGLAVVDRHSGFTATVPYFIYAVIASVSGQYVWQFDVIGNGPLTVEMHLTDLETGGSYAAVSPVIGGNGGLAVGAASTGGTGGRPVTSALTYQLFWERLDYLLGHSDNWRTCQDARRLSKPNSGSPKFYGLCSGATDYKETAPARLPVKVEPQVKKAENKS